MTSSDNDLPVPQLLELFSGTGSVGKVANALTEGFGVISVDNNKKSNPTICADILEWDYKQFEPGHFEVIWASPPCNTFSRMVYCHIGKPCKDYPGETWSKELIVRRQEEFGLPILNKVKEIIDYFKPKYYFIENPLSGRMKDYMTEYKHTDVCYCMYGFDYKKPTRIWHNNAELDDLLQMCNHKGKHIARIGKRGSTTLNQRYSIPPELIEQIFQCVICDDEYSKYLAIPY